MVDATTSIMQQRAGFNIRRMPGFGFMALVCVVLLYGPLLIMALFSFNSTRSVTLFTGFSLDWYAQAAGNERVQEAALLSFKVAIVATVLATIAATISKEEANISNVQITDRDGIITTLTFIIEVRDRLHLANIMRKLRVLELVSRITRARN